MLRAAFRAIPSRAFAATSRQAIRHTHSYAGSTSHSTSRNVAVVLGISAAIGYSSWTMSSRSILYADEVHPPEEGQHESQTPSEPPKEPVAEADNTSDATPPIPEGESEEDPQSAAFNPETGEINWDCPCLGGMAHGPCGEEFREAFSCFVYSEKEPKGIDCVEKFQAMQNCFRAHPDVYGEEIADDDEPETSTAVDGVPTSTDASPVAEEPEPEKPRRKVRSTYWDDD